ncbi:hypothetical protein HOLleu_35063 [Holothuria leucospilota]|uniref:Uncharacterized protein n=1 Tax=Holothuria leucospilota TaxID=206669 RepID=A0A9Q0YM48_HOLLE|nr:hypothetical protein HOLleu_35063 [Holothuria leucospilota]
MNELSHRASIELQEGAKLWIHSYFCSEAILTFVLKVPMAEAKAKAILTDQYWASVMQAELKDFLKSPLVFQN